MKLGKRQLLVIFFSSLIALGAFAGTNSGSSTSSGYSIGDFLKLLGALGLFLFGMKYMSEGIQKAAGNNLRNVLKKVTSNSVLGVLTGLFVTTIVQSSSATTVMVVSFTNAGLFSLTEAISVVMGANIGTTVTAWIVAVFGLKVSVAKLALPIMGMAFPFLFFGSDKVKNWAEFVIGFALLFFGLGELKDSVPDINSNPEVLNFIQDYAHMGFGSVLLFILVGTILTIVVQSSSASMALTLVLLSKGWIDFPTAAAMVLGENIGTTITAQLAGLMANINAKRAAMAHTLFNLIGVFWMIILFRPFLSLLEWLTKNSLDLYCSVLNKGCGLTPEDVDLYTSNAEILEQLGPVGLAIFHTSFNIINVLLLIGFVPFIAKIVKYLLKSKEEPDHNVLRYLDSGLTNTPELAIVEVQKELIAFAQLTKKMYSANMVLLRKDSAKKAKKAYAKIAKLEDDCDQKEQDLAQFLAALSSKSLSRATSQKVRALWSVINDLERIGDLNEKIMLNFQKRGANLALRENEVESIVSITKLLDKAFYQLFHVLDENSDKEISLNDVEEVEKAINKMRNELRQNVFIEIENGHISFETGLVVVEMISNIEKIADHIYSINSQLIQLDTRQR
ncbi:MAG: Na/Pi cotransporter family protein [Bacteroidetes bacterium]|nr:Na/Pi cotransporter family protein [Bacteroidota bacterium]